MKKTIGFILVLCTVFYCLAGCEDNNNSENVSQSVSEEITETSDYGTETEMFTERDTDSSYSENGAIIIKLEGDTASASDKSVIIDGSTVTITKNATHIVSGTLNDGSLIVAAEDTAKLQIVLDNVNITGTDSAPLYIKTADKVFVTLVGESTLSSGESFKQIDESNIDATVFSKQDITFNGEGVLNISAPAGHGIVSKDDLVFTGGVYNIVSASHAVDANDSVRVKKASITADSGKDGIHAENNDDTAKGFVYISSGSFNIECEGDGISAGSYVQISDGEFNILAGGGYENGENKSSSGWGGFGGRPGGREVASAASDSSESMKGIKAVSGLLIQNGNFKIDSADDSLHCDTSLTVNGGVFEIASGDDALHAEEKLCFYNGTVNITHSYEGLEALHVTLSGGNIKLNATDDGINAAGGTDQSGFGGRDDMFGGRPGGKPGGGPGGMGGSSDGSVVISGGILYIKASGDGIDANGTLEITGGHVTVVGPTQGDTATLDYDVSGIITGGTFIGTGASGMAQTFSSSEQGVISLSAGKQTAGTEITVTDSDGNVILEYAPELDFQVIIISTPVLISGKTYTVTVGSETGSFKAN